eukprot:GHVT01087518.1.p1 GENE.GHVT01087518.1~~GHVT01087518.1.p1  ORF type:complete len:647 (+),score=55.11 GHVT01087518.1:1-1941(+)
MENPIVPARPTTVPPDLVYSDPLIEALVAIFGAEKMEGTIRLKHQPMSSPYYSDQKLKVNFESLDGLSFITKCTTIMNVEQLRDKFPWLIWIYALKKYDKWSDLENIGILAHDPVQIRWPRESGYHYNQIYQYKNLEAMSFQGQSLGQLIVWRLTGVWDAADPVFCYETWRENVQWFAPNVGESLMDPVKPSRQDLRFPTTCELWGYHTVPHNFPNLTQSSLKDMSRQARNSAANVQKLSGQMTLSHRDFSAPYPSPPRAQPSPPLLHPHALAAMQTPHGVPGPPPPIAPHLPVMLVGSQPFVAAPPLHSLPVTTLVSTLGASAVTLQPPETFWEILAAEIADSLESHVHDASIEIPEPEPFLEDPPSYAVIKAENSVFQGLGNMKITKFVKLASEVTDKKTLLAKFPWLVQEWTSGQWNIDGYFDLPRDNVSSDAHIWMLWPCTGNTWKAKHLVTGAKYNAKEKVHKNLWDMTSKRVKTQEDCSRTNKRRLEQGDGVLPFKDRVMEGAFNFRTKYDADGQQLECFDYKPVKGVPIERFADESTQEIARDSYVEDGSSGTFGGKLGYCLAIVGSFFSVGVIFSMLWQRKKHKTTSRKKPSTPRQSNTPLQAENKLVKTGPATKELDGGSNTPDPSFANSTTSTPKP